MAHKDGYIMGPRGTILKPMWNPKNRYWWVKLRPTDALPGEPRKTLTVHTLMALAFRGPKPVWAECARHLDDNRDHNYARNIEWGTHKQNGEDMVRNGKSSLGKKRIDPPRGSRLSKKLDEQDVMEMRQIFEEGLLSYDEIASCYGVTRTNIHHIIKRNTWKHV